MHISDIVEEDGFVQRSDSLIFAIFKNERAYMIKILDHNTRNFSNNNLLKIVLRNWRNDCFLFARNDYESQNILCAYNNIPRSSHNPEFIRINDLEIIGNGAAKLRPVSGHFFA